MLTQTVTVAYNNPPQNGKKQGSIKTTTGEYFNVWPDKLHLFPKDATLTIEYQTRDYQGKTYKTAVGVVGANGAQAAHTPPRPQISDSTNQWRPTSSNDASRNEHIFVCGALNASIKAGQLSWNDQNLVTAINAFRTAYSATFGADE